MYTVSHVNMPHTFAEKNTDFNNTASKCNLKDFVNKLSLSLPDAGSLTRESAEFCDGKILDICSGWRGALSKATWES